MWTPSLGEENYDTYGYILLWLVERRHKICAVNDPNQYQNIKID